MRIGEKTQFARIWPSVSKIVFCFQLVLVESAKRWCANRLPTKPATTTANSGPPTSHPPNSRFTQFGPFSNVRNPHAHKNSIGTSTPPLPKNPRPPPQKNEEFYGHGNFPAERTKRCQAPTKLAQPRPQNYGRKNCGREVFLVLKCFLGKLSRPHIGRYCDTIAAIPRIMRDLFREVSTRCDTPSWY